MLGILGLGLRGYNSITVEERSFIEKSDRIILDSYTSVLFPDVIEGIENNAGKKVETVDRSILEGNSYILNLAEKLSVSLLVLGDPFMATTHNEIRYQCLKRGIEVRIFENASILNSVIGYSGLSPYRVGAPVSLPRVSDKFFPLSVYRKIGINLSENRHTILLLDTADGNPMTVKEALETLAHMEEKGKKGHIKPETEMIAVSALGRKNASLVYGQLKEVKDRNILTVPSTLIILAELDENEKMYVGEFCESA